MSLYHARSAVAGVAALAVAAVALACGAGDDPVAQLSLHEAVEAEDLERLRALPAEGVDLNTRDAEGRTALHLAAHLGFWPMEQDLLDAGAEIAGKVSFIAVVTDDLIEERGLKAGDIVRDVAQLAGGSGGGKAHLAQAGGRDPGKIDQALAAVAGIVERQLDGVA